MPDTEQTEVTNPFLTYNFLVKWDGKYVAAVTNVSGLTRRTSVVEFHAGGQPQSAVKIPGQTGYEPVRLERGITTDTAFEDWAQPDVELPEHAEARHPDAARQLPQADADRAV